MVAASNVVGAPGATAVPGFGPDSAQQVIAEVGPQAATFATPQELASWVGVRPGREESAEKSKSDASPQRESHHALRPQPGRPCRPQDEEQHLSTPVPSIAAAPGSPTRHLGDRSQIIPHGVDHSPSGRGVHRIWPGTDAKAEASRTARLIRRLRRLGYQVTPPAALTA